MKHKYKFYIIPVLFCLLLCNTAGYGQKKKNRIGKNKSEVSAKTLLESTVVNNQGTPIANARITVGEGVSQTFTDKNGHFSITANTNTSLLLEAKEYRKQLISLNNELPAQIVMERALQYNSELDEINLPLGFVSTKRKLVGAVSKVDGALLTQYPDLSLSNTLQGRLMGLYAQATVSGLGNNVSNLTVRGQARGGNDDAITLVDGIERPIDFINPEEVESVEVLKDPSTKILYGPRAANGVILVTTKRGKENTRMLKVTAEYGVSTATRLPKFLDSYQYATLYNEARLNDGLTPFYSQADLNGYKNSSGENDQLYPNVDYYQYFINKMAPIRKASVDYTGGTENSRYALILGYAGADGFEKVGKTPTQDRINLRGNLDFQISPAFKAFIDASGIIEKRSWSGFNQDQVFNALSSNRPNEYPIFITDPNLLKIGSPLGFAYVPPLGGSFLRPANLYGSLMYGGFTQNNYFYGQTNFGLDLNLGKVIKGLSVRTSLNFDNYQTFQSGKNNVPVTYSRQQTTTASGQDTVVYANLQQRVVQDQEQRQNEGITRNFGITGTISYQRTFGESEVTGSLSHFYYRNEDSKVYQNIQNINSVLNVNYSFKNKLYFNGSLARMGSNKFADNHKYEIFPAVGLGWILSEEHFLKQLQGLSFLKLKGSFGILGYDRATDFYQYQSRWQNNGTYPFNEVGSQFTVQRVSLNIIGNPNLGWEKSREINIGLEGAVLDNQISFEFNYFNNLRYDIIISPDNYYSALAGGLYPRLNMGRTSSSGVEGAIDWHKQLNKVSLTLGGNFVYSKNKVQANGSINNIDPTLNTVGQPTGAIFGYVANGLFTSDAQIAAAPQQMLGSYKVGDIAYQDLNGDKVIDGRDRTVIGSNFPSTSIGFQIDVKYKRFGLNILQTAELGMDNLLDNNYYRNGGENKYSVIALDRYHPVNNPTGSQPRLSTLSSTNNNVVSTFWVQKANFTRLKNAQLSYQVNTNSRTVKSYKFFVNGTNLFVLSGNKDLDPEVINAGVNNYPLYRTITFGGSIKF